MCRRQTGIISGGFNGLRGCYENAVTPWGSILQRRRRGRAGMTALTRHSGRCLCGSVQYVTTAQLRGVIMCHCSQCRRTSGHHVAMTSVGSADLQLGASATLTWYRSSAGAERGFCRVCGGNLFWRQLDGDTISIAAGTLDAPTGLIVEKHIYVGDKSDYDGLNDEFPKWETDE